MTMWTPQGLSRILLSWTAPAEAQNGGGDITGYRIEYSDSTCDEAAAEVAANSWRVLVSNTMSDADPMYDRPMGRWPGLEA